MKKTPNAERRTPTIEWLGLENAKGLFAKEGTLNAQRSTSNAQRQTGVRFDLEERLLEFSSRIIRLVDALPKHRAANHIAGQLFAVDFSLKKSR